MEQPKDYEKPEELNADLVEAYNNLNWFGKLLYRLQDHIILALVAALMIGYYVGINFPISVG